MMTDGARGVLLSNGKLVFRAGVYKEKRIADRTGAGDAFASGFLASLLVHATPASIRTRQIAPSEYERAIRFASANATSVVEVIGAEPGILKKGEFERSSRWRKLPITHHTL